MTTFPDVPFVDGQIWSPELAYLAFHQSFGDSLDQDILGNHPGITDEQLSQTGVLARVNLIVDGLKPSIVSGLSVKVASGAVRHNHSTIVVIPETTLVLPNNTTSFLFIRNSDTVVSQDTRVPSVAVPIARVVTSGGSITTLTDLRQAYYQQNRVSPDTALVFGGQSSTDKVCTAGEVFDQGIYYFRDFTVPNGVSITVSTYAVIKCSGKVNISGTIDVTANIPGGVLWSGANYNVTAPGSYVFPRKGSGLGAYGTYSYGLQPYGSGGDTGQVFINSGSAAPSTWATGRGGNGGGGLNIQAALGIDVYGTINAKGGDATNASVTGGAWAISGCAGGSGGCVILSSPSQVTLRPGSTINVSGGKGGNAAMSAGFAANAGSGGGGSGGVVVLQAPSGSINTTGSTITLTGGSAGNFVVNLPGDLTSFLTGSSGSAFMTNGSTSHVQGTTPVGSSGLIFLLNYLPLG